MKKNERGGFHCDRRGLARVRREPARGRTERKCAGEDDTGNDERDDWVAVHAPRVVGEPDEQPSADNSHVSELQSRKTPISCVPPSTRQPTHRIAKNVEEHSAHVHRSIMPVSSVPIPRCLVVRVTLLSMIVSRMRTMIGSGVRPRRILSMPKLHPRYAERPVPRVSRALRAVPSVVRRLDNVLPELSWVHEQLFFGELLRIPLAGGGRAGSGHGDSRGGGGDGGGLGRRRLGKEGSAVGSRSVCVNVLGGRLSCFLVAVRVAVSMRVSTVRVSVV